MKFSSGLVCRKNIKAEEDADVIKQMKKAGAILLCTTNVSELGLYYESSNHVNGQTKNPYDTRRMVIIKIFIKHRNFFILFQIYYRLVVHLGKFN